MSQLPSFYFRRFGQYLCEVTVTEEDQAPAGDRYRAHLDQVERETADGHIPVTMDVPDVFGPSRYEAVRALERVIMVWLRMQAP